MARGNVEAQNRQTMQRVLELSNRSVELLRSSGNANASQVISQIEQLIANQEALLQSGR